MSSSFHVVRTEKKFRITHIKKSMLIDRLSYIMSADEHSNLDGYPVRSLYFDSIYDDDYMDKLNGFEYRKKIRLRIYSPDNDAVKLEMKEKRGAVQRKKTVWIPKSVAQEMIKGNYSGLLDVKTQFTDELYCILESGLYRPKCIIEYHRVAFMERSNDIRVTFDSNIGVSSNVNAFFDKDISYIPVLFEPVLEVKYNGFLLSNIRSALELADASELSVSKYTMSRELIQ